MAAILSRGDELILERRDVKATNEGAADSLLLMASEVSRGSEQRYMYKWLEMRAGGIRLVL